MGRDRISISKFAGTSNLRRVMKKEELIETALALGIAKKDLAGKNKAEIEALIAAANDKKPESDGSDLLGGETSEGASSAPSEEPTSSTDLPPADAPAAPTD